jgi:hypothetical protein
MISRRKHRSRDPAFEKEQLHTEKSGKTTFSNVIMMNVPKFAHPRVVQKRSDLCDIVGDSFKAVFGKGAPPRPLYTGIEFPALLTVPNVAVNGVDDAMLK